jgi:coproporphyrinogen III oxidase
METRDSVGFVEDTWERPGGGGGRTRVIQDGTFVEKGGVNISSVYGELSEGAAADLGVRPGEFGACGISIVIHPRSPRVPSIHMNVRYFELDDEDAWYGGGIDLTPYYPHTEDFTAFHRVLRDACERADPGSYERYKKRCDEYFTVTHRGEMRGIGGVFFDYLREDLEQGARVVREVGDAFLPSFLPIADHRADEEYTGEDRTFQLVRRGRYVEFNLVYDRGTLFGLKTGGRIESILMSLPPDVAFPYNFQPRAGSPHEEMLSYYQPHNWLS